jgi:hypothetical protein
MGTTKGQKRELVFFFYGRIKDLSWDPGRLFWPYQTSLPDYTTAKGRAILRAHHPPLMLVVSKWAQVLPEDFQFPWADVWDVGGACKESGLLWRLTHCTVAVKVWHVVILPTIVLDCLVCNTTAPKSVVHHFWKCSKSERI